jgi:hypothetical protein
MDAACDVRPLARLLPVRRWLVRDAAEEFWWMRCCEMEKTDDA